MAQKAELALNAIYASRSWRITAPIRALIRLFRTWRNHSQRTSMANMLPDSIAVVK